MKSTASNQAVYICNHCHQYFQNEQEKDHPLYAHYKALDPEKGNLWAYEYLSMMEKMIGEYDILYTRAAGTVPTICGCCGMIGDEQHQIAPVEEDMLTGFERVTQPHLDHHWFSEGSMRFFNTAICTDAASGFFITSESTYFSDGSKTSGYTIRRFTANGVDTIGEFLEFESCDDAADVAGQKILECAVIWNHMAQPCFDHERGKGECSEMHVMATETLLKLDTETRIRHAFPMHYETLSKSHAKSLRWTEWERDEFFDALRGYHFEKQQQEEEGEAA